MVTEKEMKFWKQLSINYMTEESDDPSNNGALITHKLPWRSQSKDITIFKPITIIVMLLL